MKVAALTLTPLIAGLLALAVLTGAATTTGPISGAGCGELGGILATIRTLESGGDYQAQAKGSSASGAYQMIDSVWRHWSTQAGYPDRWPHAWQAPPAVQDAAAEASVRAILDRHHNQLAAVPVAWYLPAALDRPELMDGVPAPDAGNTLTPRQYQQRWLTTHQHITSQTADTAGCSGSTDGEWALPVPRDELDRRPAALGAPHHDYPAWDYPTPTGTPIYALHAGTVTHTSHWTGNCYGQRATCPTLCGVGLTIVDPAGVRYSYCHATTLTVRTGQTVQAGQQIATSGNTGHSSGPHLHLGIRVNSTSRCPQPLLTALYHHIPLPPVTELPTTGCTS